MVVNSLAILLLLSGGLVSVASANVVVVSMFVAVDTVAVSPGATMVEVTSVLAVPS